MPASSLKVLLSYFLQKPSPFAITTQLGSFSKPFIPVSEPAAVLIVSVLPLRVNSIASPFAVPSKVFEPSGLAISIEYFSPFFATFRDAPSTPCHFPRRASGFPLSPITAGLPDGDAAGDPDGAVDMAGLGLGDAGVFTSVGFVHAPKTTAEAAKAVSRIDLPNLLMFIVMVRAVSVGTG